MTTSAPFIWWNDPPMRYLRDGRDYSIVGFPRDTRAQAETRIALFWDPDRDTRIIPVLIGLYIRDMDALAQIVAVGEHAGVIEAWRTADSTDAEVKRALQTAADRVMFSDRWRVGKTYAAPMRGTVVDWQALPPEHPLHAPAKSHQLGVVEQRQ